MTHSLSRDPSHWTRNRLFITVYTYECTHPKPRRHRRGACGRRDALGRDTDARSGDDDGDDDDDARGNDGDEVRGVRAELVARRRWTRTTRGRDAGGAFEREDDGVEWERKRQRERWGREDEREEEGRRGGESAPGTHS